MRLRDRKAGPVQAPSANAILGTAGWVALSLLCGFVCFVIGSLVATIGARGATQEDARGPPAGSVLIPLSCLRCALGRA